MSRWKFPTFEVVAGDNKQEVRGLTAGERSAFIALAGKIKRKEADATELPRHVVKAGAVNPTLSDDDIAGMPPDLLDLCTVKIMELTGLKTTAPAIEAPDLDADETEGPEKKGLQLPN